MTDTAPARPTDTSAAERIRSRGRCLFRGRARWLFRGLVIVAFVLVVAVAVLWSILRASLPMTQGEVAVPGLEHKALIARDTLGIPTITADSWLDAVRAQGFVHAQDRFFQMDLARRAAAGELAELLGPAMLDTDRRLRVYRFRERAVDLLATLSHARQAMLGAYVDGVNAGLASLGSRPPEYWLLGATPQPWTAIDTLLVNDAFFMMLSFNRSYEQPAGVMHDTLPVKLADFLLPDATRWDVPLMLAKSDDRADGYAPAAIPGADVIDLRQYPQRDLSRDLVRSFGDRSSIGSNAWCVAGSQTTDGRAILAGDPHLALRMPTIWYRTSMHWKVNGAARMACGVSIPGAPSIIIGATDDLAWSFTNSYGDQEDLVRVEVDPDDPGRYRTPDGWEPFTTHRQQINISGQMPQLLDVVETRWGPVIGKDHDGTPLAFRCVALDPQAMNLNLLDLVHATTLDEGLDIAASWFGPGQNVMLAGTGGHIGWTLSGWFPQRVGHDGLTPSSWADGTRGWAGPIDESLRPRVVDPSGGVLLTANARTMPTPDSRVFGQSWSAPWRAHRIEQMFDERSDRKLSESDLLDMQLDTRSWLHDITRDILLEVTTNDDDKHSALGRARTLVEQWNGRADLDQPAFRILRECHEALRERIIGSLLGPCADADPAFTYNWPMADEPLMRILEERPAHLVPKPYSDWHAYLRAILTDVVERIAANADAPLDTPWGRVHMTTIKHPVFSRIPLIGSWFNTPLVSLPGHATTVRMTAGDVGVSMRMVVSPGRWDDAILHIPGGQSGHPLSSHYADQQTAWVDGAATPMLPGSPDTTLTLRPARSD